MKPKIGVLLEALELTQSVLNTERRVIEGPKEHLAQRVRDATAPVMRREDPDVTDLRARLEDAQGRIRKAEEDRDRARDASAKTSSAFTRDIAALQEERDKLKDRLAAAQTLASDNAFSCEALSRDRNAGNAELSRIRAKLDSLVDFERAGEPSYESYRAAVRWLRDSIKI